MNPKVNRGRSGIVTYTLKGKTKRRKPKRSEVSVVDRKRRPIAPELKKDDEKRKIKQSPDG